MVPETHTDTIRERLLESGQDPFKYLQAQFPKLRKEFDFNWSHIAELAHRFQNEGIVGKKKTPAEPVTVDSAETTVITVDAEDGDTPAYTAEYLETLSLKELRPIGAELGVKGRSKVGIIADILAAQ